LRYSFNTKKQIMMLSQLIRTEHQIAPLFLRVTLGFVVFRHGIEKFGTGYDGFYNYATQVLHVPSFLIPLTVLIETLGCLSLIVGFWVRPWALMLAAMFTGFILFEHAQHGFFMNWYGNLKGEGYEYHLLVLAMCAALMASGAGRFSADRWWMQRRAA
jgi:putative oxidoreductase